MAKPANAKKTKSKSKKPRLISLHTITKSKRNLALAVMVVAFVVGGTALTASSFAASSPKKLKICNYGVGSQKSNASIAVYHDQAGTNRKGFTKNKYYYEIAPGKCNSKLDNWSVRVDVDAHGWDRTHSYKLGKIDIGGQVDWGPCHKDSSNSKSNPPNNSPHGVMYRTYRDFECDRVRKYK